MLLSIDRVLQLLTEGKSVQKISEMAEVEVKDVYGLIDEARKLLAASNRDKVKRKIIIKKREAIQNDTLPVNISENSEDNKVSEIFDGAELSMIPLESSLIMYIDGASKGNPGPAGLGIVINDDNDRQIGTVSSYLGIGTNNYAEYMALIRALKIAHYFKTKILKIRTDSELVVKQIKGEYRVLSKNILPLYNEALRLKKRINSVQIEHVTRSLNDRADYLANKALSISNK
ncbi:MAG: ribonuclease HI family protein [Spirochaetota bacterium]|nr:ribonuclease HI family protein [Spirochaetota bacterium]